VKPEAVSIVATKEAAPAVSLPRIEEQRPAPVIRQAVQSAPRMAVDAPFAKVPPVTTPVKQPLPQMPRRAFFYHDITDAMKKAFGGITRERAGKERHAQQPAEVTNSRKRRKEDDKTN
jgi:hypothetical protein